MQKKEQDRECTHVWNLEQVITNKRKILDGILVANEAVTEARRLKKELLLFKVDFEKAYDSVDFHY